MNGKINQLRAGVVLTYVSLGVGYLVSMAFTPVMIRLLGQNEYGLYTLVLSVAAYLNLLNFGFGASYMRFYARFREHGTEDDIRHLNGLFLLTFVVIAAVALVAGLIVAENVDLLKKTLMPDEVARARVLIRVLPAFSPRLSPRRSALSFRRASRLSKTCCRRSPCSRRCFWAMPRSASSSSRWR